MITDDHTSGPQSSSKSMHGVVKQPITPLKVQNLQLLLNLICTLKTFKLWNVITEMD